MERHELYDRSVVMHYYDDDHKYVWDGQHLPSSTQITGILDKPALRYWYVNKALDRVESQLKPGTSINEVTIKNIIKKAKYGGTDARDNAANIGILVHDWVEGYINGQLAGGTERPPFPHHSGAKSSVESYLRWEDIVQPEYIFSERRMISKKYVFAGTLDIAALIDPFHLGKAKEKGEHKLPTIVDIKTGKAIYPEYWLQTASYALMIAEEYPPEFRYEIEDIQRLIVLITQATGQLKQHEAKTDISEDAAIFLALRRVYQWKEGR